MGFVVNKVELGIVIPTIEPWTNQVSQNKGIRVRRFWFKAMRFLRGTHRGCHGCPDPADSH